jgi:hypothetical protein
MQSILRKFILTASFSAACICAQVQVIPQVADGAGWRSTIILTNTTAQDINGVSLTFNKDIGGGATAPWSPTFLEGSFSGSVPAGSAVFLHTPGTGALSQGWAQLIASSGLTAYVIYTYSSGGHDQDSTAPAVSSATRVLVPFDNTIPAGSLKSLSTALAVVNPSPIPLTISVNLEIAGTGSTATALTLPANGQMAFVMASQFPTTAGQSGLAEFYTTSGSFSIIALRGNPTGGLTSLRVYNETGAPVISTSGGGGGGGGGVHKGDITFAGFNLSKLTTSVGITESIGGTFDAFTPTAWNIPFSATQIDKCYVYELTFTGANSPSAPSLSMDAGKITLAGPGLAGGSIIVPEMQAGTLGPAYQASSLTLVDGGTYTLSGAGGTQVEAFSKVSATLPNSFKTNVMTISSIDRSKPLPITWTGTGFDNVDIGVVTTTLGGGGTSVTLDVVTCVVPASLGTYSIPAAALAKLSATAPPFGSGSLSATTAPAIQGSAASRFIGTALTPNLVGGGKITYGDFTASFTEQQTVTVQ